jgi:monofunctional biosynthetic peptidoglycan transglycosylase
MGERKPRRRRTRSGSRGPAARWALGLFTFVIVTGPLVAVASIAPIFALRNTPPPTTAYMLRSRNHDPATGEPCGTVAWHWVDRAEISPELRLAVVVAEDQRFLLHNGFDTKSIRRALRDHGQGPVRGASTISQQVAKNLFLWPGRSWFRKGVEAWLTFWIEALWSKQRILEVYLNVAQFGPCLFGAGAASERFFGVSSADLTPAQAALLATVLPNPKQLRAHDPGPYALKRRGEILALMTNHRGRRHLLGL